MDLLDWYLTIGAVIALGSAAAAGETEWHRTETWVTFAMVVLAWPPILVRAIMDPPED